MGDTGEGKEGSIPASYGGGFAVRRQEIVSRSHGLGLWAWVASALAAAGVSGFQSTEGEYCLKHRREKMGHD